MWIFVSFDLPTGTPAYRKAYTSFRKHTLEQTGFLPLHESLYYRWSHSAEHASTLKRKIQQEAPADGKVFILSCTDATAQNAISIQQKIPENRFETPLPASLF